MKLLFDENLSYRTVASTRRVFPGSVHVSSIKLEGEEDELIWRFARSHGFVIVSADNDFVARSLMRGQPPKVIHVQALNATWKKVARKLIESRDEIAAFILDVDAALLMLRVDH